MQIVLNGKTKELRRSPSLKELILEYCSKRPQVIAELNGNIIKSPEWDQIVLKEGDTVELLGLAAGG